jgi:D-alanyl-D-alanine carboxypeptidase (penicillin-binding protein 5/6)
MLRLFCVRAAALGFATALVNSCSAYPPPAARPAGSGNPPPVAHNALPLQVALIPPNPPPAIVGQSAIVVDIASGRVLFAKNADLPREVASTQKIITALCVLDAGDIDQPVTIQANDAACEPTKLDLKPGEVYTRRELLKVLMVKSANDVARALARDVGGNPQAFAELMNRKSAALGMRKSNFITPNGLPVQGQYSTARDMAIAARAAYRSPLLRSYAATKAFSFVFNDGHIREIENTNRLLKSVPYCNGLKTGTTNAAGRCLVATGSLNGRAVIVVVLKSTTPNIWKDSTQLLRWALERPTGA